MKSTQDKDMLDNMKEGNETLRIIETGDKRLTFLQYLNTTILAVIGTITMVIFAMLTNIKAEQIEFSKELLRLKTVQDINVSNVGSIETRLTTLELNYLEYIKTWVDQNYVRRPQAVTK